MKRFTLSDSVSKTQLSQHDSVESGFMAALTRYRLAHSSEGRFVITDVAAELLSPSGDPVYTIALTQRRPVGRPPLDPEARVARRLSDQLAKPFRFNGRPPASGWLSSPKLCELDLELTKDMIPVQERYYGEYHVVYMDRDGLPLAACPIKGLKAEGAKRTEKAAHRSVLDYDDIALEMAGNATLPEHPSGAVAVFVVKSVPGGTNPSRPAGRADYVLRPVGKRVLAGWTITRAEPTKPRLSLAEQLKAVSSVIKQDEEAEQPKNPRRKAA